MNRIHTDGELPLGNPKDLPVVKTCYDLHRLNEAIKHGHKICIMKITEQPQLCLSGLLLQNKSSGEYTLVKERRVYRRSGIFEYSVEEWETIHEVNGYARTRRAHQGWGAYILPLDVKLGDRVYVDDLLEDSVSSKFWYSVVAAVDGEGIWDGSSIKIDESLYTRVVIVG